MSNDDTNAISLANTFSLGGNRVIFHKTLFRSTSNGFVILAFK